MGKKKNRKVKKGKDRAAEIIYIKESNRKITNFSFENILSILSLIVSVLTLYLGYVAYQKFLDDRVKTEQLDLVVELVDVLQKEEIVITMYPKYKHWMLGHAQQEGNVYAVGTWQDYKLDYDIYLPEQFSWYMKVDDYIFNPLLPEEISEAIIKFRFNWEFAWDTKIDSLDYFPVIGNKRDTTIYYSSTDDMLKMQHSLQRYKGGMRAFVNNANNLTNSIRQYFGDENIGSVNAVIFNKAKEKYPYNMSSFDRTKRKYNFTDEQTEIYLNWSETSRKIMDSMIEGGHSEKVMDSLLEELEKRESKRIWN